ncbi:hypothetical protein [Runella sp. SP2]|uniref:hypothetical protein n=1 Tax=Runella sp. SP2 TaxID=2268026 RepID=UPI000F098303|nr:hypothetical protein [Runella sp. SP2]AYQ31029.1 hypothetical protein DTQ70_02030 [Runella sp. SP2]
MLVSTATRISLQEVQKRYIQKYAIGDFLAHEESYISEGFALLFDDLQQYFGNDLLMFDAYYLAENGNINSVHPLLKKVNQRYNNLSNKFCLDYSQIFEEVKAKANQYPNSLLSISEKLIIENRKTGFCFFKTIDSNSVYIQPIDCLFVNLNNFQSITARRGGQIDVNQLYVQVNELTGLVDFDNAVSALNVETDERDGFARTFDLYDSLLQNHGRAFVYFIRPRVAHGEYNGTLTLFLSRQLIEDEFNIISSFINDILCETTIARAIHKTKTEMAEEHDILYWGTDKPKSDNQCKKKRRDQLVNMLKDKENDISFTDQIYNEVQQAVEAFLTFFKNPNEMCLATSVQFHEWIECNSVCMELSAVRGVENRFRDTLIIRRTILCLCQLRNNNKIIYHEDMRFVKNVMPRYVLDVFKNKVFSKDYTIKHKSDADTPNYRKNLASLGLHSVNSTSLLDISVNPPYVSLKEKNWLWEQKITKLNSL